MTDATPPNDVSAHRITATDLHLFNEGSHFRLYEKLGAHVVTQNGVKGVAFSVWAPNAAKVSVVGGFNEWDKKAKDFLRDAQGNPRPKTSHSLNAVPCYIDAPGAPLALADASARGIANVAATTLQLLGYEAPEGYLPSLLA